MQCVVQLMQQLMEQPLWDVRCGGYLGLKYTLAGRLDLGNQLLQVQNNRGSVTERRGGPAVCRASQGKGSQQ